MLMVNLSLFASGLSESVFTEISLIIAFAAAESLVIRLLKQPHLIGHIFTRIMVLRNKGEKGS